MTSPAMEKWTAGWRPSTWPPEMIAAVEAELKLDPNRSDLLIAKITDTSKASVLRIRNAMVAEGVIPRTDPRQRFGTIDDRLCTVKYHFKKRAKVVQDKDGRRVHPLGISDSRAIKVPEGKLLSDVCREGVRMENETGLRQDKVAAKIGIGKASYRRGRLIIMLADNPNLTGGNKEAVLGALKMMDEHRSTANAYSLVEHLDHEMWGKKKRVRRDPRTMKKHIEGFETTLAVINEVCSRGADAEIPSLTKAEVLSAMEQLEEAIASLRELYIKLGRRNDNDS
jgi:hypothetical protein